MPTNPKANAGPDPQVMQAIQRLVQTELSPLEEVIFQSWMQANQMEESPDMPFDYRGLYQQTGGKVFAPGELSNKVAKQHSIDTLMKAQEAHDSQSPMRLLEEAKGTGSSPDMGIGGGPDTGFSGGAAIDNVEPSF